MDADANRTQSQTVFILSDPVHSCRLFLGWAQMSRASRVDAVRRSLSASAVVCTMVLFACGRSGDAFDAPARVSVHEIPTGHASAVEVRGLGRAAAQALAPLAPNDTAWRRLVTVYVEGAGSDSASGSGATSMPPVIGRYAASDGRIRFKPRFPFAAGVAYRVEVDTAALARVTGIPGGVEPGTARLVHRFALPSVVLPRTTRVVAVHPSSPELPENLLRWYVETSAPMDVGNALANIHLMDDAGREVRGAFLALDQEL